MLQTYGDNYVIVGFDSLEYCSSMKNFSTVKNLSNFRFVKGDICDSAAVETALKRYHVDAIVHLAARTHVDDSFDDPRSFTKTNALGTQSLLEAARKQGSIRRFIHVSTDEVYGENNSSDLFPFTEEQTLSPTNPYAASKAAAEMIVRGYQKPFQIPIIIARCNNVFGPCQYPESKWRSSTPRKASVKGNFLRSFIELIPKFITLLKRYCKMPIHGRGKSMRSFLFAADAAEALDVIFHRGAMGETYNISSNTPLRVWEVAEKIMKLSFGPIDSCHLENWTDFVPDRLFNDSMYWTDGSKLEALGWRQRTDFDGGLQTTITWYHAESENFWLK